MKRFALAAALMVLLALVGLAAGSSGASASPGGVSQVRSQAHLVVDSPTPTITCVPSWSLVETPTLGYNTSELNGVKAFAADDVWAVGDYITNTPGIPTPPPTAPPPGFTSTPVAVTSTPGLSPDKNTQANRPSPFDLHRSHDKRSQDQPGYPPQQTITTHWNGSAWTVIASPNGYEDDTNILTSVDGVVATDVWAAGYYINSFGVAQTLVERWNGTAWAISPSANAGPYHDNQLFSIQAVATDDVWAVGAHSTETGTFETLIEHWNGTAWSVVPSPNAGQYDDVLRDLAVVSANDIWAVGYSLPQYGATRSLAMHWDGSTWTLVAVPSIGSGYNYLASVDASGPNDVWAVGNYSVLTGGTRVLAIHWDGSAWTITPTPSLNADYSSFMSVDMIAPDDVWAVGSLASYYGYTATALTEHWNGTAWEQVRAPGLPFASSIMLSSVSTVSTDDVWAVGEYPGYPSSSPQAVSEHYSSECVRPTCQISFSDIQASDYYYFAVRYLYCHNAISGYADRTFRPGNSVTRGQLTKIITLAEDWSLIFPQTQHFTDVYPWDPFYLYIETAYANHVVTGYADGTFRPGNNVTRGQISKVIVLAQEWPIDISGAPHFSDVPPSDPFYHEIETAYNHGVISGYADGTFRPNNSATRGQLAKIVFQAVAQRQP